MVGAMTLNGQGVTDVYMLTHTLRCDVGVVKASDQIMHTYQFISAMVYRKVVKLTEFYILTSSFLQWCTVKWSN